MQARTLLILFFLLAISPSGYTHSKITTGAEHIAQYLSLIQGKRVGMVVNHTSIVGIEQTHLLDTLLKLDIKIVKVFAPEHGFRGNTDAGETCDAYHITSPLEDGSGAARAMELAMEEAGVKPEEVTYINAHGTSTHHNDLFETRAIRKAFGDAADHVLVNSTKSMVGHLLGAAGGVEDRKSVV